MIGGGGGGGTLRYWHPNSPLGHLNSPSLNVLNAVVVSSTKVVPCPLIFGPVGRGGEDGSSGPEFGVNG